MAQQPSNASPATATKADSTYTDGHCLGMALRTAHDVALPRTLLLGPAEEALRFDLRLWLQSHLPDTAPDDYYDRIRHLRKWQADLAKAGFVGVSWPKDFGGRGLGVAAEAAVATELAAAGAPELINRLALFTIAPTVLDYGTEKQRAELLPGMLDASEIWCQGFSEPGAGSDLAGIRTIARVDGDRLIVSGQKVWTTRADVATWCIALIRTEPGQARHRGLSLVAIPMATKGISRRPLLDINDHPHFAEVFFDDVEVPRANVIGELNDGWRVAMSLLGYERGLFALERLIQMQVAFNHLLDVMDASGRPLGAETVGRVSSQLAVLEAQVYQTLAAQAAGEIRPGQTAVDKLLLAEAVQSVFACAVDSLGPTAALEAGEWADGLFTSRSVSIYGGTSEIQRNVIARQLLGLPGERS